MKRENDHKEKMGSALLSEGFICEEHGFYINPDNQQYDIWYMEI